MAAGRGSKKSKGKGTRSHLANTPTTGLGKGEGAGRKDKRCIEAQPLTQRQTLKGAAREGEETSDLSAGL